MKLRDHVFLGATQSLCPECLRLVPAKIIVKGRRVYFRKRCPEHGVREDFVCSDVEQYDRMEFSLEGKMPAQFGVEPERGCPFDCGLCTEHEQHTCVGLVEITSACNLSCPMCYASSGPGGKHLSFDECVRAIDRLVEVEGRPEVLQLSGGEPTIYPDFVRVLRYACQQPIDMIMINTNGLRLAHDRALLAELAEWRHRLEVYFQFDGFRAETSRQLRGEPLVETKLAAIDALGQAGVRVILVCTLQAGVNDDEIGALVRFGLERPWITGISFQPATYSGRHVLPDTLERRITFPDVVRAVAEQTDGLFQASDFMPLPCAHPNCHSLSYAYRSGTTVVPLARFIDARQHLDLLANGITFTRARTRELIERYLGRMGCCSGGCGENDLTLTAEHGPGFDKTRQGDKETRGQGETLVSLSPGLPFSLSSGGIGSFGQGGPQADGIAGDFFARALAEQLSPADVFRITITSFLDAYNFDVRRLMKCCIHHVLPSGHVIPFCAYNVLYREGHVSLPRLMQAAGAARE